METIVTVFIGTFCVAVIGAVFAFANKTLDKSNEAYAECREENKWYREKLLPTVEKQQDVLEATVRATELAKAESEAARKDVQGLRARIEALREELLEAWR